MHFKDLCEIQLMLELDSTGIKCIEFLVELILLWRHFKILRQVSSRSSGDVNHILSCNFEVFILKLKKKKNPTCIHVWMHQRWLVQSPERIQAPSSCCSEWRHWPSKGRSACVIPELHAFKYTYTYYSGTVVGFKAHQVCFNSWTRFFLTDIFWHPHMMNLNWE